MYMKYSVDKGGYSALVTLIVRYYTNQLSGCFGYQDNNKAVEILNVRPKTVGDISPYRQADMVHTMIERNHNILSWRGPRSSMTRYSLYLSTHISCRISLLSPETKFKLRLYAVNSVST